MTKPKTEASALKALRETGSPVKAARILNIPRTTFYSVLTQEVLAAGGEPIDVVQEHALKRELKAVRQEKLELVARLVTEQRRANTIAGFTSAVLDPPEWLQHVSKEKIHHATIVALFSDLHLDEVVNPAEVNHVNAYNREIAVLRVRKFFSRLVKVSKHYIGGVKIDGLLLAMLGDMVSGNIHEELERTNEAPILDTCVYWAEQFAAGIEYLLASKVFPKVHIDGVTGNHGRLRKRPQYKNRARDNYDWLIYKMLETYFRAEPRVTFTIPDGPETRTTVFATRFLWTHGDSFSGGTGIGGIAVPIMRGDAKKQKVAVAISLPYDYMGIGHWHTRMQLGSTFINGTTKGYDEFSLGNHFNFEEPQQSLLVVTPERGVTVTAPIFVRDKQEKWT